MTVRRPPGMPKKMPEPCQACQKRSSALRRGSVLLTLEPNEARALVLHLKASDSARRDPTLVGLLRTLLETVG